MKWGNSALVALALTAGLAGFSAGAVASTKHPTYALGAAKHCRSGYVKIEAKKTEKVRVKLHGKWVERSKTVRYAACEYIAVAATAPVFAPTTTTEPAPIYPAPVITVPTSTTTTTTTTTTVPPAPPMPVANILTVFIDPTGTTSVTGQFVGVTSLVLTGGTNGTTGAVNTCTALVTGDAAQCTLSLGNAELGLTPAGLADEMTGGHVYPDILTVTSAAGIDYVGMGAQTSAGFWEYPVVTPPVAPMSADGPVGLVTVANDPASPSTCGAASCLLIDIAGYFPSTGTVTIWSAASPPSVLGSEASADGDTITVEVPGTVASLEESGFQIAWSGGFDYGKYDFPSKNYPYWPTNRVETYNLATGTWS